MNKKRILSFLLAIVMIVTNFTPVFANNVESSKKETTKELEVKTVEDKRGNKRNSIQLSPLQGVNFVRKMNLRMAGPKGAPVNPNTKRNVTVNINITKNGLDGNGFDWDEVFGANGKFTVYAYYLDANYNRVDLANKEISSTDTSVSFDVSIPTDVNAINVETSFVDNMDIKAFETPDGGQGTGTGEYNLSLEINQIVNPKVNVLWVDPYGQPVQGQETKAKFGETGITLPGQTKEINLRNPENEDDDAVEGRDLRDLKGKTLEVENVVDGKVNLGGVDYKVTTKLPTAKDAGEIKFESQPDVIVPPIKDGGNPVDPAEGYVRLTFDANENKVDGVIGKHNAGDYAGQQKSYIDVKEGLDYTNANLQAAIKALATTGTKVVNGETKTYTQDAENPWTPAVPADATKVAIATYNAQYKKSAAEQVEELGGLNPVTIKVWKEDPVTWKDGVAPKTTNTDDAAVVESLLAKAKVTDQSRRSSKDAGKFEGKLLVTFEDKSTLEVDKQWLYVWEHIVTVDPNNTDPNAPKEEDLPGDKIKVLFEAKAKGGVKEVITKGTTYAKNGTVFQDEDFPSGDAIKFDDGYKGPVTWTPASHTISNDLRKGYDKRRGAFVFRASATKLEDIIGPVDPGKTPNPDTNNYWTVTFKSADEKTGTVDAKNTYYVLKTANKTLADLTAPNTTPAEGYTFNKWTPAVDKNTVVDKDIEVIGTFAKDVVPQKPGEDKPDVPDNFVKVDFSAGDHGTIAADQTVIYWVNPDAGKTLADITKPTVTANEGWKFTGWDKADTEQIGAAGLTVTAQYKEKVVTTDPQDTDYVKVNFATSKGTLTGQAEYWVLKNETVSLTVPTVDMGTITDYTFKAWNPAVKTTYTEDTTHNATFTYSGEDVVPQPGEDKPDVPDNFVLVEFKAGDHGTFAGGAVTKYWVNPDAGKTLADVTKPTVVANKDYKFTSWDKEDTTAITGALEVTAQYKAKVVTTDPQDPDYVKVNFATSKGTLEGTAEYWVLKDTEVTVAAPTVKDLTGYEFKAWDPAVKTTYTEDTTHNATFNYTGDDIIPVPDPENPPVKPDGFVDVVFDKGAHGEFADGAVTKYFVNPNAGKTLADITKPGINAAEGWKHTGWDKADTEEIKANLTVTAQYKANATPTKNSEDYDPHYVDKSGKPGETVQIDSPTFTKKGKQGTVPAPTDGDKKTTFTKNNPNQPGVTVDPNTGAITVEIPENAKDGDVITVPVDVTYPDGSNETVEVKVKVENKVTPPEGKPSVTYPTTDMDKGETKTVIPEIKDKKGEPTRPDTTPEVVQPGNGVVVTPHPDGSITVTIPEGYDGPSTIVIPVEVTVDGEKVKTNLIIRVNDDKPVIDYDIPELKIHEYTPTYPVYTSVEKKVVEVKDKEVVNSHDQYIFGYPDDTIRPDGDMTRAEAIAVVARLQKLDLSDKSSKIYKDTKADMWYNGAINAAFREGYLLEKEGENVRPNDKITRAELAELISHIDKKNNAIAPFDDVKGHKFEAAINQAYGNGRIEGYPDGTFKPDNFITRAEVATMLNKLYDRYPDKNFIDANQNLVHNYKDMSYKGHWGYYELVEAYHSHTYLRLKDNMEEWKVIIK